MNDIFFVFDVESVGLLGHPVSVGWVVVDRDGKELDSGLMNYFEPTADLSGLGQPEGVAWVRDNLPAMPCTHQDIDELLSDFTKVYEKWHNKAIFVADCPFPVEANFLFKMLNRHRLPPPYPLLDVASVLFAVDIDPMATYSRKENELPRHNPTADSRQSARLLLTALKIRELAESKQYAEASALLDTL